MAEHIPKTDEEIEWEEIVYKAEKADFERRQKKSVFEVVCELVWELSYKSAFAIIFFIGILLLMTRLIFHQWPIPIF